MSRRKRLIDLSTPSSISTTNTSNPAEFLRITLANPRKSSSRGRHQHSHLSVREERKAAFTKASWIQKHSARCKLTLPKFKVSLVQQPVSGIFDKLRGAWSRVKHLLHTSTTTTASSSPNSYPKSFSVSKRSGSSRCQRSDQQQQHHPLTGYSQLNNNTSSSSPGYHQDAVADCIEFIKQSAAKV